MRTPLCLVLSFVACGAVAGWLTAGLLPEPPRADELQIWTEPYRLERRADEGFEVRDGRWLRVPRLFADFDLHLDIELGPDMDVDLLARHVEPRYVQGRIEPFTERFVALRLTTGREGSAWRTREQALFGERGVGASLAPGLPATVWMQGRGRLLRANVAGRWTDWCEAEDSEGMFAVVAHGGTAVLSRLVIENRGVARTWLRSPWAWSALGAFGGLLLAAVALCSGRVPWRVVAVVVVLVVGGAWGNVHRSDLEPLRLPPPGALLALLAAPLLLAGGALATRAARRDVPRVLTFAVALVLAFALRDHGLAALRSDTRAVDAVFGADAGNALGEALAGIVRGPFQLHDPATDAGGVFLLGGRLLYGRLGPDTEHLEPLLAGALRGRLARKIPVVSLPTEEQHAHAAQQWAVFLGFYTGYRPRVLVFGVAATEGDLDEAGERRSWPSTLAATLREARQHARAHGAQLVLFTEAGLDDDLAGVLRTFAGDGVPLVVAEPGESADALGRRLTDTIEPLLRE